MYGNNHLKTKFAVIGGNGDTMNDIVVEGITIQTREQYTYLGAIFITVKKDSYRN